MPTTNYLEEGPYSALFPYEELKKEEEEKKKQLQASEKKIQKTNAVGEGLRLLIDAVGGSKGATIRPRNINPGIMKASEKLYQIERDSDADLDRLSLMDLQNKQNDLRYNQGLAAEARGVKQRADELTMRRGWEQEDQTKKRDWEAEDKTAEQKFRADEAEKSRQGAMNLEGFRSKNDMDQIFAREDAKKKEDQARNPFLYRYTKANGTKAPWLVVPDTELAADIPLGEGDALKIMTWIRSDPAIPQWQKNNLAAGDQKSALAVKDIVVQNYDRYKDLVRKLASGQTISPEEEKSIIRRGQMFKRTEEYNNELTSINESGMNAKRRVKAITKLNGEYQDLFNVPEIPSVIPADANGVTDVSSLFN